MQQLPWRMGLDGNGPCPSFLEVTRHHVLHPPSLSPAVSAASSLLSQFSVVFVSVAALGQKNQTID